MRPSRIRINVGGGPTIITGTGDLQAQLSAIAGVGTQLFTGTGALDSGVSSISGSGAVGETTTGTGDLQAQAAVVAGVGTQLFTGTGALDSGVSIIDGTGTQVFTGTGDLTTIPSQITGSGAGGSITGTGDLQAQSSAIDGCGIGDYIPIVPGIQGFGTDTPAGRGGTVYRVTSLSSAETGSGTEGTFLWCIRRPGPKVVIFDVSGEINYEGRTSNISLNNANQSYTTIAGQTAPSPGITLRGAGINIAAGVHDVFIQHIRIRLGDGNSIPNSVARCFASIGNITTPEQNKNIVVDHCSMSWGQDENCTMWQGQDKVTISNCIISEPIESDNRPGEVTMGMAIGDNDCTNISIVRNMFAHCHQRHPRIKFDCSVVALNGYVYNQTGCAAIEADNPVTLTVEGYVHKSGVDSSGCADIIDTSLLTAASETYVNDCSPPGDVTWTGPSVVGSPPIQHDNYSVIPSANLEDYLIANAGARPADRDSHDTRVLTEVVNGTGSQILSQTVVGGWDTTPGTTRVLTLPNNYNDVNCNGYTNLELWLHNLAADVEGSADTGTGSLQAQQSAISGAGQVSGIPAPANSFKIQHINDIDVGASGTSQTIDAVDLAKTFIINSNSLNIGAGSPTDATDVSLRDGTVGPTLSSTTSITYNRSPNAQKTNRSSVQVVEYVGPANADNEFKVRARGVVTIQGGTRTGTAGFNLSTPVDIDKCVVFINGLINNSSTTNFGSATCVAWVSDTSTINFERGGTSDSTTFYFEVVEFTGVNWTIHHAFSGDTAVGGTVSLALYDGQKGTGSTTSVSNWNKAFVYGHYKADDADGNSNLDDITHIHYFGADNATVRYQFDSGSAHVDNQHLIHVIENSDADFGVAWYSDSSVPAPAPFIDKAITALDETQRAIVVGKGFDSGGNTTWLRGVRNIQITSTTNVRLWSHREGNFQLHRFAVVNLFNVNGSETVTGTGDLQAQPSQIFGEDPTKGTGSLDAQAADVLGFGIQLLTGTGNLQSEAAAIAGTGTQLFTGTGDLSAQAAAISGAGTQLFTGTGALQAQESQVLGTGGDIFAGTGDLSAQTAAIAGAGTQLFTGTGVLAAQAAEIAGTGTAVEIITGTGDLQAETSQISGAGTQLFTGTGDLTAQNAQILGTGGDVFAGTGNLTAQTSEIAGSGTVTGFTTGTGDLQADVSQISGTGLQVITGTGDLQAQESQILGTAGNIFAGTGALAANDSSVSGTGTQIITGTGDLQAQASTIAGVGVKVIIGTGALAANDSDIAGAGTQLFTGTGDLQAQSSTIVGTAEGIFTATGNVAAQSSAVAGVGEVLITDNAIMFGVNF